MMELARMDRMMRVSILKTIPFQDRSPPAEVLLSTFPLLQNHTRAPVWEQVWSSCPFGGLIGEAWRLL